MHPVEAVAGYHPKLRPTLAVFQGELSNSGNKLAVRDFSESLGNPLCKTEEKSGRRELKNEPFYLNDLRYEV